jgi:hypothetical protein
VLTLMLILSLFGPFVVLMGALFLSAKRTIRATGFFDGIIGGASWLYGLLILLGANRQVVIDSFPEAICMHLACPRIMCQLELES